MPTITKVTDLKHYEGVLIENKEQAKAVRDMFKEAGIVWHYHIDHQQPCEIRYPIGIVRFRKNQLATVYNEIEQYRLHPFNQFTQDAHNN